MRLFCDLWPSYPYYAFAKRSKTVKRLHATVPYYENLIRLSSMNAYLISWFSALETRIYIYICHLLFDGIISKKNAHTTSKMFIILVYVCASQPMYNALLIRTYSLHSVWLSNGRSRNSQRKYTITLQIRQRKYLMLLITHTRIFCCIGLGVELYKHTQKKMKKVNLYISLSLRATKPPSPVYSLKGNIEYNCTVMHVLLLGIGTFFWCSYNITTVG